MSVPRLPAWLRTPLFVRLLPDRPILAMATLWGLGRVRPGPGTWGTAAGMLWYIALFMPLGVAGGAVALVLSLVVAVWVCGEAEIRLRRTDPPEVVLDEFVAVPLCFAGLGGEIWGWRAVLVLGGGFLLFRFLDIVKPLGIARLQRLPGGWGVVADDVAAAGVTCLVLHAVLLLA